MKKGDDMENLKSCARLKSGGPVMPILRVTADGKMQCKWLEEGEWREGFFDPEDLIIVADAQGQTVISRE